MAMSNSILVTGGLGVVGRPLVEELRKRGHEVWALDRAHHHDSLYFRCDISDYRVLAKVFEDKDFDSVYHLAAEFGRQNGEDFYETMWKSNAIGTKNVIRLQEKLGYRLIFTSSSEVYGDYRGRMAEDVLHEVPIVQMNDYAMSKWVNEMQIMNSARRFGTETVRLRLFNTYGPGEYYSPYRSAICLFIYRALRDVPYTVYTKHKRTSSYIDDTVHTIANVVERFKPGEVYNIAGSEIHDMKTASDMILGQLGKDDELVEYAETEQGTTLEKQVDISKAIRDLDHGPKVNLEEGIRRTIRWQREVYGIS